MMERLFPDREKLGADGSVRKAHYGSGRQPWDDILDEGWGPGFAAGCVLRYLRRDKAVEHSLESARWYMVRLLEHGVGSGTEEWQDAIERLRRLLTHEERQLVGLDV